MRGQTAEGNQHAMKLELTETEERKCQKFLVVRHMTELVMGLSLSSAHVKLKKTV